MSSIKIISTSKEQAKSIKSALRFFKANALNRLTLYYIGTPELQESDITSQLSLKCIPAASMADLAHMLLRSNDLLVFTTNEAYLDYCGHSKLDACTLCVHPDLSLLYTDSPKLYHSKHFTHAYLMQDIKSAEPDSMMYRSFSDFVSQRAVNELLITNNTNLVQALTSVDTFNWDFHHPLHNAISFGVNTSLPDASTIRYRLNQALLLIDHSDLHSPQTISQVREQCTHSYSFFAKNYDEYMSHVAYDSWVRKIKLWFKQYCSRDLSKIIELACGTANISTRFVFEGYHVDACDLSAEMLAIADTKPFKPNLYQACLTDPIPGKGYDLALCMFDSVNYLTKSKQLAAMLQEVHSALADGGLFIFDISTLFNSEENFADTCSLSNSHGNYMVHQAWFEPVRYKQNSALTAFTKGFLAYSHRFEQHNQRVYLCADIINQIHKSPFKLKAIHSSESRINYYPKHLGGIDDNFSRLFFVLAKDK